MIKKLIIATSSLLLIAACSGNAEKSEITKESLIEKVNLLEDSIKRNLIPSGDAKVSVRYADKCLAVYRTFPASKEAPEFLDKAHVILSSNGLHSLAVLYADTLIRKYPSYKNRPMVLQSLASSYDLFIIPRKKEVVLKYYQLLLKENPNLPKEEKENIEFRIKYIDKTFDELIDMQTKD